MANLSNINNKFIVTSETEALIGATSWSGVGSGTLAAGLVISGNTSQFILDNPSYNHFTMYSAGDSNIYNIFGSSGNYLIGTGNKDTSSWSEKMRIDSSGRLGIGTDSPDNKLDIALTTAAISFDTAIKVSANTDPVDYTANRGAGILFQNAEPYVAGIYGIRPTLGGWRGHLLFYTHTSASNNTFGTTFTEKMRITDEGNVGIGTSSPTAKLTVQNDDGVSNGLHVIGDFNRSAGTDAQLILGYYANGSSVTGPVLYAANSKPLLFAAGGTEKMRIGIDGTVDINLNQRILDGFLTMNKSDGTYITFNYNGSTRGYLGSERQIFAGGSQSNMGLAASGDFVFGTGSYIERMRITSAGNVGIGTTSPNAKLEVITSTAGYASIIRNTNGANDSNGLLVKAGTGATEYALKVSNTNDTTNFMVVKGNGNVGIGTTGPAAKLHVKGGDISVEETGGNGNKIFFTTDHNSHLITSNGYWIDVIGNAAEVFRVFGGANTTTEFFRITGSGDVGIGTDSPPAKLSVYAGGADGIQLLDISDANNSGRVFYARTNGGSWCIMNNATNYSIRSGGVPGSTSGTEKIRLTGYSATSWTAGSDETIKENIKPIGDVLNKIDSYRCIEYNLIDDETKDKKIGFIAQDWQEDFPQIVEQMEDEKIGMKYTETIPVLLKAIQELKADNDSLKARIETLENN